MKRMIFATGNENKMVEIREILGDLPLEILSMKQAGIAAVSYTHLDVYKRQDREAYRLSPD